MFLFSYLVFVGLEPFAVLLSYFVSIDLSILIIPFIVLANFAVWRLEMWVFVGLVYVSVA